MGGGRSTNLEATVNEGFVQVKDKALSARVVGCDWGKERSRYTVLDENEQKNRKRFQYKLTEPMGIPAPPL
jgi:hypothetical protein